MNIISKPTTGPIHHYYIRVKAKVHITFVNRSTNASRGYITFATQSAPLIRPLNIIQITAERCWLPPFISPFSTQPKHVLNVNGALVGLKCRPWQTALLKTFPPSKMSTPAGIPYSGVGKLKVRQVLPLGNCSHSWPWKDGGFHLDLLPPTSFSCYFEAYCSLGRMLKPATLLILKLLRCQVDVTFNEPFHDQLGRGCTIQQGSGLCNASIRSHDLAQIYMSSIAPPHFFWWCHDGHILSNFFVSSVVGSASVQTCMVVFITLFALWGCTTLARKVPWL